MNWSGTCEMRHIELRPDRRAGIFIQAPLLDVPDDTHNFGAAVEKGNVHALADGVASGEV